MQQSQLVKVGFCRNEIGDKEGSEIFDKLALSKIEKLDLCYNDISDVSSLGKTLCNPECVLTHLDLGECVIGDFGAIVIADAIIKNPGQSTLVHLNLSVNMIGDKGAKAISEAIISKNCNITFLDLSCNLIGDDGCNAFTKALHHSVQNCKLLCLSLGCNTDIGKKVKNNLKKQINLINAIRKEKKVPLLIKS